MNKKMAQTPEKKFSPILLRHPTKNPMKDDKSLLVKHITDTLAAAVAFTASLVIAFLICYAAISSTLILSVLKSLIDLFFASPTVLKQSSPHEQKIMSSSAPPKLPVMGHDSFSAPQKTRLPKSSKKTLFLGLRRTLVRFSFDLPCYQYDFVVYPLIEGNRRACYVLMRPGLDKFLHAAKSASFEVVIYTRLPSEYASPIIDMLDPTGELIAHRLYQNACTELGKGVLLKDLVTTGRKLHSSVIIDNHPRKHVKQWTNAIALRPFLGDPTDTELLNLLTFFEVSRNINDLRPLINITLIAPAIPTLPLPSTDKKTLFLDLDHTLIHATTTKPSTSNYFVNEPYFIRKRPGIEVLFSKACRASFEIVIFTAASAEYASPILDWLDPDNKYITHRLYRNACTPTNEGYYKKDLTTTGRKLDLSVIIDDNPTVVLPQENALFVRPFKGDSLDVELWKLLLFFNKHSRFDDMRIATRYMNGVLHGFSNGRRRRVNCCF